MQSAEICPHFHLSLQSGCTETLKRMNRKYSAQEYAEKCELIGNFYPVPALTTDVIVGFPGKQKKNLKNLRNWYQKLNFMRLIFLNIPEDKEQKQHKWIVSLRNR